MANNREPRRWTGIRRACSILFLVALLWVRQRARPAAGSECVHTALTWGGAIAGVVTIAFLFLPGMRDTERDGSLTGATLEEEPVPA